MIRIETAIENEAGIHCRPSSEILMKRQEFADCEIRIISEKGETDLNSILSLLSLALSKGDKVTIEANGKDEEQACRVLADLFAYHFDFPPQDN